MWASSWFIDEPLLSPAAIQRDAGYSSTEAQLAQVREPRVSFVMVPTVLTAPQPTTGWQLAVSTGLALATAVCCVQLGLTAEVSSPRFNAKNT
jgi:hypothetical protein